jgi:thioredoxin-dependent peroxiredoxin
MSDIQPTPPAVSAPAPDFTAVTGDGRTITLSTLRGQPVVVYFYPRDDTPGCTREACGFRDLHAELLRRRAVVFGVSTDSAKSHRKFAEKHRLPFDLLTDEDRRITEAYGAWGQKTFMGRKFMGTLRKTFLIGPDGRIARIWDKVKPDAHAAEVLAALDEL